MRPSAFLFPEVAELRIMRDSTGEVEPILEEPIEVACLVGPGLRRVETSTGREEVSTMTAYCPGDTPNVPTGSRLTVRGQEWIVVRSMPWRMPSRPDMETVELHLQ